MTLAPHFVGLDVSLQATSICVRDDTGKIVLEHKIASDPEAIAQALSRHPFRHARVGLEAGQLAP